jgi:hypothetical protein
MFGFRRQPKQMTDEEYAAEYRRLLQKLGAQFAIGNTSWEQIVHSMSVINHEMNGNGGCNWVESEFREFLDTLEHHLTREKRFSPEQLKQIEWSLNEIITCGRELETRGESSRNATKAVDYLIHRVVDWCELHLRE